MQPDSSGASDDADFRKIGQFLVNNADNYLGSHGPARLVDIAVDRNPYSRTAKLCLHVDGRTLVVYVKRPTIDQHNRAVAHERLDREFRILRRLSDAPGADQHLGVVRPIAYLPDWPALVTEEARGPTLQALISRGTRRWLGSPSGPELESVCEMAGKWLRHSQSETAEASRRFETAATLEYCQIRVQQIRQTDGALLPADFSSGLQRAVERLAARLPADGHARSARHNDYAPHNIIVTGDGLRVLDFTMCDTGETCYDPANFWERLQTLKLDPLRSRRQLDELQSAFLSGYGDPEATQAPGFTIARIQYRLARMATLADAAVNSRWRRLRDGPQLRDYRRWLLERCAPGRPAQE